MLRLLESTLQVKGWYAGGRTFENALHCGFCDLGRESCLVCKEHNSYFGLWGVFTAQVTFEVCLELWAGSLQGTWKEGEADSQVYPGESQKYSSPLNTLPAGHNGPGDLGEATGVVFLLKSTSAKLSRFHICIKNPRAFYLLNLWWHETHYHLQLWPGSALPHTLPSSVIGGINKTTHKWIIAA